MVEKALRTIALGGIFAVPFIVLIISGSLFFPYITGKNFTFRILVEIIGCAWFALALINTQYRPRRSWITLAVVAFVAIIGIADLLGVNPAKSFGSNFERMEGWVTIVHLGIFFLAATSLLTPALWKRWWQTTLAVSGIVGLYGLAQFLGLTEISTQSGPRIDATLGNATYLGVYMLFHVFVAALLLLEEKKGKDSDFSLKVAYWAVIALNTFVLFFTATRGAILGLLGGVVLAGILYFFSARVRFTWHVGAAIGVLVILVGGFWAIRDTSFVQQVGPLARLASISFSERTIISRFMNAGMAWEGFKERPILGWGQENYAVVFDKNYNPEMYAQEPWFDRVHNVIFDWLVAGGLLGLIAYLALYGTTLLALWRSATFDLEERSVLTGLFAGYFFYLLFTFDNIMSYVLFFAFLAYIATRSGVSATPVLEESVAPRSYLPVIAGVMTVFAVMSIWSVNGTALAANRALILALSPQPAGYGTNLEYFKEAISYNSFGTQEAREHLSQAASQLANPALQVPENIRNEFLQTAAAEMTYQMEESPLNARFPLFLAILLDAHGAYADAQAPLAKAHELSPRKQSILFEMGLNAYARGDMEAAFKAFKEARDLAPDFVEAQVLYFAFAVRAGKLSDVQNDLVTFLQKGETFDERLLSAFASQNRFDLIILNAESRIQRAPEEVQPHLTKAAAEYVLQKRDASIATLENLKKVVPNATAQADSLIAEIKKGTLKIGE